VSEGVSAFLSRVLNQLSITAWLPAVFLVGNAAVLFALQGHPRLSLTGAVEDLVGLRWGALIVIVFAVIIMAMVIQAFDFESLRFLEGYLRSPSLGLWAAQRITIKSQRRDALVAQESAWMLTAFDQARRSALDDRSTRKKQRQLWDALEKAMHQRKMTTAEATLADRAALTLRWTEHADPGLLHSWDISRLRLAEYPEAHRVLPTRLGNVMRAAEDQVSLSPGEDLEGWMIRHEHELPATIVAEHDAYRRRLDMYIALMFAQAVLTGLSVFCLWGYTSDLGWRIAVPAFYLSSVGVCYRAAIASALGFGQAAKEGSRWLDNQQATAQAQSG
jgi:hypothetical protein